MIKENIISIIGQVAKILGVSRDILKFYEEKELVKPKQNIENGYRRTTSNCNNFHHIVNEETISSSVKNKIYNTEAYTNG